MVRQAFGGEVEEVFEVFATDLVQVQPTGTRPGSGDLQPAATILHKKCVKSFCKSQFPQKSVKLSFIITDKKQKHGRRTEGCVGQHAAAHTRAMVRQAFGGEVEEVFEVFCAEPCASGSVAQVHPLPGTGISNSHGATPVQ